MRISAVVAATIIPLVVVVFDNLSDSKTYGSAEQNIFGINSVLISVMTWASVLRTTPAAHLVFIDVGKTNLSGWYPSSHIIAIAITSDILLNLDISATRLLEHLQIIAATRLLILLCQIDESRKIPLRQAYGILAQFFGHKIAATSI